MDKSSGQEFGPFKDGDRIEYNIDPSATPTMKRTTGYDRTDFILTGKGPGTLVVRDKPGNICEDICGGGRQPPPTPPPQPRPTRAPTRAPVRPPPTPPSDRGGKGGRAPPPSPSGGKGGRAGPTPRNSSSSMGMGMGMGMMSSSSSDSRGRGGTRGGSRASPSSSRSMMMMRMRRKRLFSWNRRGRRGMK